MGTWHAHYVNADICMDDDDDDKAEEEVDKEVVVEAEVQGRKSTNLFLFFIR